jgi:hypothetical protein
MDDAMRRRGGGQTRSADADASCRDDEKPIKTVCVRHEQSTQCSDLLIGSRIEGQPKVDHAPMRVSLAKDQVAEIAVIGDDDSVFSAST